MPKATAPAPATTHNTTADTAAQSSSFPWPGNECTKQLIREMTNIDIMNLIIETNEAVAKGIMSRSLGTEIRLMLNKEIQRRVFITPGDNY